MLKELDGKLHKTRKKQPACVAICGFLSILLQQCCLCFDLARSDHVHIACKFCALGSKLEE